MIRKMLVWASVAGLICSCGLWGLSYFNIACLRSDGYCSLSHGALRYYSEGAYLEDRYMLRWAEFKGWGTVWWPSVWFERTSGLSVSPSLNTWRSTTKYRAELPLWVPTILFGLLLTCFVGLPAYRRRRLRALGRCVNCAYDLRGSTERCPECGTAFTGAKPPSPDG